MLDHHTFHLHYRRHFTFTSVNNKRMEPNMNEDFGTDKRKSKDHTYSTHAYEALESPFHISQRWMI